jgi:hypothetical protein
MTTIAWDGKTLAADTLVSQREGWVGHTVKIGACDKGLYGACGKLPFIQRFLCWAAGDRKQPPTKDWADGTGVIIGLDGKVREWDEEGWIEYDAPHYAWGSGFQFALAAMDAGADARRAVEIAFRDHDTGGEVITLSLDDA